MSNYLKPHKQEKLKWGVNYQAFIFSEFKVPTMFKDREASNNFDFEYQNCQIQHYPIKETQT